MNENPTIDWKLKLRYGKIKTAYQHFTVLAEGKIEQPLEDFDCPVGNVIMGMKVWASSSDEAIDMIQVIGEDIGFKTTGRVYIYDTEPTLPPQNKPHGYDIQFTPFNET